MRSLTQRLHMNCWGVHCLFNHSLDKYLTRACFLPRLTLGRRLRNKLTPTPTAPCVWGSLCPGRSLRPFSSSCSLVPRMRTSFPLTLLHCGCTDQCLEADGSIKSIRIQVSLPPFFLALGPLSLEATCDGNTAGDEASRVGR